MADSEGKKILKEKKKELKADIKDLEDAKLIQLNEAIALQAKIDAKSVELDQIKADINKL